MTVALFVVDMCSAGTTMNLSVHVYPSGTGVVTVIVTVSIQKRNAFRPVANEVSPLCNVS